MHWKGSFVALATPFTEKGEVDLEAIAGLIEWHIASETDGIVLCGTTGESPTVTHEEKLSIFKLGAEVAAGRIPIIAGTGSNDTRSAVSLTEEAQGCGVDGALVVVPYYNRPTPEGCLLHFAEVAKVGLPLIAYHHPGRTAVKLPVETLAEIASLPSVAAVKEGSCDLDYATELLSRTATPIFTGDDSLLLPFMSVGAIGVISIVANIIPQQWHHLTQLMLKGNAEEARALFFPIFPLVKSMVLETNPQCVKYALSLMGKCGAKMRLPLVEPKQATKELIEKELESQLGLRN